MTNLDVSCAESLFVSIGTTGEAKVLRDMELQVDIDEELAAECTPPVQPVEPEPEVTPASGCACSGGSSVSIMWLLAFGVRRRRRRR